MNGRPSSADDHAAVWRLAYVEFPYEFASAYALAILRTFAIPAAARLLHRTGEFERRGLKRFDDTDLLMSEILEHGPASERGSRALARIRAIHSPFAIPNAHMLYALAAIILEPPRWIARRGARRLGLAERIAHFRFWRVVGVGLGIEGIPATLAGLREFSMAFERSSFAFSAEGRRVACAARDTYLKREWGVLWRLLRPLFPVVLDRRMRGALGLPALSRAARRLGEGVLFACAWRERSRARRRGPRLRTALRRATYPHGYEIDALGPHPPARTAPTRPASP